MLREACVKIRLQPAVVLHALGERIADDADAIAFLEFELGLGVGETGGEEKSEGSEEVLRHERDSLIHAG